MSSVRALSTAHVMTLVPSSVDIFSKTVPKKFRNKFLVFADHDTSDNHHAYLQFLFPTFTPGSSQVQALDKKS